MTMNDGHITDGMTVADMLSLLGRPADQVAMTSVIAAIGHEVQLTAVSGFTPEQLEEAENPVVAAISRMEQEYTNEAMQRFVEQESRSYCPHCGKSLKG